MLSVALIPPCAASAAPSVFGSLAAGQLVLFPELRGAISRPRRRAWGARLKAPLR